MARYCRLRCAPARRPKSAGAGSRPLLGDMQRKLLKRIPPGFNRQAICRISAVAQASKRPRDAGADAPPTTGPDRRARSRGAKDEPARREPAPHQTSAGSADQRAGDHVARMMREHDDAAQHDHQRIEPHDTARARPDRADRDRCSHRGGGMARRHAGVFGSPDERHIGERIVESRRHRAAPGRSGA